MVNLQLRGNHEETSQRNQSTKVCYAVQPVERTDGKGYLRDQNGKIIPGYLFDQDPSDSYFRHPASEEELQRIRTEVLGMPDDEM